MILRISLKLAILAGMVVCLRRTVGFPRRRVRWICIVLSVFFVQQNRAAVQCLYGQVPQQAGSTRPLSQHLYQLPSVPVAIGALQQPVGFHMTGTPIVDALSNISQSYGITIWLDRRIAPGQLLTFRPNNANLETALEQIASLAGAEMQLVENVVYIGPKGQGPRIAAVAAILHDSLSRSGTNVASPVQPKWAELATPNEVLLSLLERTQLKLRGELPHDLWRANKFQRASSLATCIALVCGGFDLQCKQVNRGEISLASSLPPATWAGSYASDSLSSADIGRIKQSLNGGTIRKLETAWLITGKASSHLAAGSRRPAAGRPARRPRPTGKMSGDIANTLEKIVEQLAAMQGLEVSWSEGCTAKHRQQFVKIHVDNATFGEIISALSDKAELKITVTSASLDIAP